MNGINRCQIPVRGFLSRKNEHVFCVNLLARPSERLIVVARVEVCMFTSDRLKLVDDY